MINRDQEGHFADGIEDGRVVDPEVNDTQSSKQEETSANYRKWSWH